MSRFIGRVQRGRRAYVALACLGLCGVAVYGCGSSSSSTSSATSSHGSSSGGSQASKKHVTIGMIQSFTAIPFFVVAGDGGKAAGAEDGNAKVIVQGPPTATGSGEATMALNLATSAQPDGFAANPCILQAWTQTLASLARTIPNQNVAAWGCVPIGSPSATSPTKTYVGADEVQQGTLGATLAIRQGHLSPSTTGTALVGACTTAVPSVVQARDGEVAAVKRLLPKATVVVFNTSLTQSADTTAWTSELAKYPHVVFAMGACDQDTASLIDVKQRHVGGNFVAGATEADAPAELQAIKSGLLSSEVTQAPWVIGNVVVRLLIDGARRHHLPQGWVNSGLYPITKSNAAAWIAAQASPAAAAAFFKPMADKVLANLPATLPPISAAIP